MTLSQNNAVGDLVLITFLVFVCISLSSSSTAVQAQIVFSNEDERLPFSDGGKSPPSSQAAGDHSTDIFGSDDYYDELYNGHQVKDAEKHKRQEGCLCLKHLKDPHCGSDDKNYDNGCYFECAQKRNPRLFLRSWGSCKI